MTPARRILAADDPAAELRAMRRDDPVAAVLDLPRTMAPGPDGVWLCNAGGEMGLGRTEADAVRDWARRMEGKT